MDGRDWGVVEAGLAVEYCYEPATGPAFVVCFEKVAAALVLALSWRVFF